MWCEEIGEKRSQLCAKLGAENHRLEDPGVDTRRSRGLPTAIGQLGIRIQDSGLRARVRRWIPWVVSYVIFFLGFLERIDTVWPTISPASSRKSSARSSSASTPCACEVKTVPTRLPLMMMSDDGARVFRCSDGVDDEDGENEQNPRELKNPPIFFGVRAPASASTSGLWAYRGASAAVTHRNMASLAQ